MNHKDFTKKISGYTILYIEDDQQIREHFDEFLSRYCKKVYVCENAEEGLEVYNKHKPDIILADINLPGMNGIEFVTYIRKSNKKIRIIMLTAYTDKEFTLKAIELELTRYLVKPVKSKDLLLALEKCINELNVNNIVNLGNGNIYSKKLVSIINNRETIPLRKKEAALLEYFIQHDGEVISYDRLETTVWDDEIVSRDAIRSQIKNIRQKIGKDCLENITGIGYKFKVD